MREIKPKHENAFVGIKMEPWETISTLQGELLAHVLVTCLCCECTVGVPETCKEYLKTHDILCEECASRAPAAHNYSLDPKTKVQVEFKDTPQ